MPTSVAFSSGTLYLTKGHKRDACASETLQLSNGTDIYTVSKMLGHRELKTTQVYAKIVDQAKRDASTKIVLDL